MFHRTLFNPEHQALRDRVGAFLDDEILPGHARWIMEGRVPAEAWRAAGRAGLLCRTVPEAYGGLGRSFLDSVVIIEELGRRRISGLLTCLQSDIVAPFILRLGNDAQRRRWLPGFCSGAHLGAIAMTEPRSGSDIQGMQTRAERADAGFVLTGEKTHISNGSAADVIIVAAQSSKGAIGAQSGISLLLVEGHTPGLTRSRIAKAGMPALDTSHLRFDGCRVPAENLLGGEGMGFLYLMTFLGIERLVLAIYAQAFAQGILQDLIAACHARRSTVGTVLEFPNTQFRLADLYAEMAANQAFVDQCIGEQLRGRADPRAACIAKLRTTETLKALAALAVQLRGAAGVSGAEGDHVSQDLVDASVQSIWGGTSEVMRDVIGRSLVNIL